VNLRSSVQCLRSRFVLHIRACGSDGQSLHAYLFVVFNKSDNFARGLLQIVVSLFRCLLDILPYTLAFMAVFGGLRRFAKGRSQ
jgi:hypothetical protein